MSQQSTATIAERGARSMPKARLHMLPNVGHFVHWEAANEVNRLILNWIKE
jgi:CheY-like chemotaxis protein